MEIIPVINCTDLDCVKVRAARIKEMMAGFGGDEPYWIHIDVADGGFTNGYSTWRHTPDLTEVPRDERVKLEVHIMSNEPEFMVREWLEAGAKRIIIHLETAVAVDAVANMCEAHQAEFWLAIVPATPVEKLFPYAGLVQGFQILAVQPGLPKQEMTTGTLEKIRALKQAYPHLGIEVDGGVTVQTATDCGAAGATQLAAGTAIFEAADPGIAYKALKGMVY